MNGDVKLYDSLNLKPTEELLQQIRAIYSPDKSITPTIYQMKIDHKQAGSYDCGLFAVAYAMEIALGHNPCHFKFDQSQMREHFRTCLESSEITPFPKFTQNLHTRKQKPIEITKDINPQYKWTTPKKTAKPTRRTTNTSVLTQNRFQMLDPSRKNNTRTERPSKSEPHHNQNQMKKTKVTSHNKTNVTNLSSKHFTVDELDVLGLGLSFCPSVKNYNKAKFSEDTFEFLRRLKLKEYFTQNPTNSASNAHQENDTQARKANSWKKKNSDWYPDAVKREDQRI